MSNNRRRTTRLYLNTNEGTYYRVWFVDGHGHIDVPISVAALRNAKPGYPWACWLANEIKAYAKRHPEAFPHPVKWVYVIGSRMYIVAAITDGQPGKTYRYRHNMLPFVRKFDAVFRGVTTTPQKRAALKKYLAWLTEEGVEHTVMMKIAPGDHKKSTSKPTGSRQGTNASDKKPLMPRPAGERTIATGAFRRAEDAGLYAPGL